MPSTGQAGHPTPGDRDFPRLANYIWRAPLLQIALAATAGILLDRYLTIPLTFVYVATLASLVAFALSFRGRTSGLAFIYLLAVCACMGAIYHHQMRTGGADDDIRSFADQEAKPARLQGVVASEPNYVRGGKEDPLRSFPSTAGTRFVLQVTQLKTAYDGIPVSGLAQVVLEAKINPVHVGDSVEIVGRMTLPPAPANPGEFDYRAFLRDQGIGVLVSVPPSTEGIRLLAEGWPRSVLGWLAVVRGWGQDVLAQHLPENIASIAGALLLGEGSGMTNADWDKYVRTGVIHVLAISGQHLVILGGVLWVFFRLCGVSSRRGSLFLAVFLLLYALLTGGRPPAMRAAWVVVISCGGMWLMRPTLPANAFALGWLGVILVNPTDIFNLGCQLSFLAVAILIWGTNSSALSSAFLVRASFSSRTPVDPNLQKLIDDSRHPAIAYLIRCKRSLAEFYLVNAMVWLAVTPLIAGTQHLITPVALLIGPPLVFLTSVALISGFGLLLAAPLGLAGIFALPVHWSLAGCEYLVDAGRALPGAFFYVPDIPSWWLWSWYLGLIVFLTTAWFKRRPAYFGAFSLAWLILGFVVVRGFFQKPAFRCTFLAVGHGGCTVVETAGGRVLVYDAGAIAGPDLTRKQIAPYLWQRGIRRIDDLFVSHADLDHFNGVTALLERFAVAQVTLTPSFAERLTPAVQMTMAELRKRGIATRIVKAGDVLDDGDLHNEVFHPPLRGPAGNENARSLVLLLRQEDLSLLLTGDLEGPGLERVLALPRVPIDILMAPHHGSKTSNKSELANWARPKIAVSSQGPPRGDPKTANPYERVGATYLTTWKDGALTVQKEAGKWVARTFISKKAITIK